MISLQCGADTFLAREEAALKATNEHLYRKEAEIRERRERRERRQQCAQEAAAHNQQEEPIDAMRSLNVGGCKLKYIYLTAVYYIANHSTEEPTLQRLQRGCLHRKRLHRTRPLRQAMLSRSPLCLHHPQQTQSWPRTTSHQETCTATAKRYSRRDGRRRHDYPNGSKSFPASQPIKTSVTHSGGRYTYRDSSPPSTSTPAAWQCTSGNATSPGCSARYNEKSGSSSRPESQSPLSKAAEASGLVAIAKEGINRTIRLLIQRRCCR